MKKLTVNPSFYIINDRLAAILSTLCTAVFLSLAIYLFLLDRMGDDRTLAVLCRLFPSRELVSVFILFASLTFMGIVAMLCYNFDMLSFVLPVDGLIKIAASVFLLHFTGIWVLYIVLGMCSIYFLSSVLRIFVKPSCSYELLAAEDLY